MARVKAVVFDMDDTLLNWREAEHGAIGSLALLHFAGHGVPEERVRDVYAGVMAENFASWKRDRVWWYIQDRLRMLVDRLGTPQLRVEDLTATFSREATSRLAFLEGAESALAAAREGGRKTALLTNGRAEVQRPKVYAFGLHTQVDFVGITGELGVWKPDPKAFLAVLDRLGVKPEHALMVGDNEDFDITPAKALGMQTAWVSPQATHADADLVVRTPGELVPMFRKAPPARPPGT
ncbi:MAG: HAD family hydrolase [Candidatus Thermoplasmatota archaeon]